MFFLVAATAGAALSSPSATAQAKAMVRIERPAIANEEEWKGPPQQRRRERIIKDERGGRQLQRLFEYE